MEKGIRTRAAILERAAMLASVDGLEQVSLARVAGAVGMSKSGLFAHFRSKEELQLQVIEAAAAIYVERVVKPALRAPRGLPRLLAMCGSFLAYVEGGVFPGGCFFAAAAAEYDARTGVVRDRIAAQQAWWLETLRQLSAESIAAGHLGAATDPAQVAFELEALMFTANHLHQLEPALGALGRARTAIGHRLTGLATAEGLAAAGLGAEAAP